MAGTLSLTPLRDRPPERRYTTVMQLRRNRFVVRTPPAPPGARIGLLGGSFNPAHAGHLQVSEIARRRLGLTSVWWIVSPGNPLKRQSELAPFASRLIDARRITRARWIEVTGFEADLGSVYTVDTLAFLKARFPHVRFVWLMGADNLATMHRWRAWQSIGACMPMAVIDRPGWHLKALASPAARRFAHHRIAEAAARRTVDRRAPAWVMLTGPLSTLSSTAIRAARLKT